MSAGRNTAMNALNRRAKAVVKRVMYTAFCEDRLELNIPMTFWVSRPPMLSAHSEATRMVARTPPPATTPTSHWGSSLCMSAIKALSGLLSPGTDTRT